MFTMSEIEPLALCMATQNLFDGRFRSNFGDTVILRSKDRSLENMLLKMKREMSGSATEGKYLEGHKMNIVNNIDRILSLVARYSNTDLRSVENIVLSGKDLMRKVIAAETFDEIGSMEPIFKAQILLPVYELHTKRSKQSR